MSDLLVKTRLRRKILGYTLTHPDKKYYVRELAGLIREDPGNLSRELKRLQQGGLYNSYVMGTLKIYSVNREHPAFEELRRLIRKTEGPEGALRSLVNDYKGIKSAFIYGSFAIDKEKSSSDIDLAVIGDVPVDDFTSRINLLEVDSGREINFTIYSEKEFRKEKKKRGSFLNEIVKGKKIILKGKLDV